VLIMLDPHSAVPLQWQLAALLRGRIVSGEWPPGRRVPSEKWLMQEYDLARNTVREALAALRAEGLVDVERGRGTRVRQPPAPEMIDAEPGSVVWSRPPTPEERQRYDVPEGVHLLIVETPDGLQDPYPAHLYRVRIPPVT
jgi:GntR family transcriptional regulator